MKIEELIEQTLRTFFNDNSIVFDKSRFAGGLTNYNYIMNIHGREYVIRQPGGMTNQMIDRKIEKVNNNIASELGLNSKCIYFDDVSGIKISEYVQDSKNIAISNPNSPTNIRAVTSIMKKIHSSLKNFPNIFNFEAELSKYEGIVKDIKGDFFFDYITLKEQLLDLCKERIKNLTFLPCHNDTVPENFIVDSSGRTYLIDWEYSGMNDPSWDVAAYILESRLTEESIQYFLLDYYGQFPPEEEILKIKCFILAQDLLWTVWALIRHYNGDDFLDYCYFRYERFRKNLKAITVSIDYSIVNMVNK